MTPTPPRPRRPGRRAAGRRVDLRVRRRWGGREPGSPRPPGPEPARPGRRARVVAAPGRRARGRRHRQWRPSDAPIELAGRSARRRAVGRSWAFGYRQNQVTTSAGIAWA